MHQDFLNPNVHRQDWSHYAAAVAATMASASMADISIKGDAYLQYADQGIARSGSKTVNAKRTLVLVPAAFCL
jgi:hypothetical protein